MDEYKSLTKRTRDLLKGSENVSVEFKESIGEVDAEVLVSFANSDKGGTVLVGVKEIKGRRGLQRGQIIGCRIIGDREKHAILSRANQCNPPIRVDIIFENTSTDKPICRIEIPTGENKPYCTSGGKYVIRKDGRKEILLPDDLLGIFLERENKQFVERFRKSTATLEKDLEALSANLQNIIRTKIDDISNEIQSMSWRIEETLENTLGTTEAAATNSEEAMFLSDMASGGIDEIDRKIDSLEVSSDISIELLDDLLKFHGLPTLEEKRVQQIVGSQIRDALRENENLSLEEVKKKILGTTKKGRDSHRENLIDLLYEKVKTDVQEWNKAFRRKPRGLKPPRKKEK